MRPLKRTLYPCAVSPNEAAAVLGIRAEQIKEAVRMGALPVYQLGTKRRVLIDDLVAWVRATWKRS